MNSNYLDKFTAKYQIDFNLVRWATENLYTPYFLQFEMDKKKIKGKMHNFDENEFKCYQQYDLLPEDLNSIMLGNIDISSYY
jgi:hypothetical protein